MRIAISATGQDLDAEVHARFGRCPYFVIVDTETMEAVAVENVHAGGSDGAEVAAARMMIDRGFEAVLTGDMGPNALRVLSRSGVPVTTGVEGTVREAAERFAKRSAPESAGMAAAKARPTRWTRRGPGLRRGATRGAGSGGGRGGGRGRGPGQGMTRRRQRCFDGRGGRRPKRWHNRASNNRRRARAARAARS